jgi:hypothetical protein
MTLQVDHDDPPPGFPKGCFLFRSGEYWEIRFLEYCRVKGAGETDPRKILERDKAVRGPFADIIGNSGREPFNRWIAGKWAKWCALQGIKDDFRIPGRMGAPHAEFDSWLAKEED